MGKIVKMMTRVKEKALQVKQLSTHTPVVELSKTTLLNMEKKPPPPIST
jgi:hypothetical protein